MLDYRLYLLDKAGRFLRGTDLQAGDDAEAIRLVERGYRPGERLELWQGVRMVRRFGDPPEA